MKDELFYSKMRLLYEWAIAPIIRLCEIEQERFSDEQDYKPSANANKVHSDNFKHHKKSIDCNSMLFSNAILLARVQQQLIRPKLNTDRCTIYRE